MPTPLEGEPTPESGRSEEPLGEETARPIMGQDAEHLRVEAANLLDPVFARREAKLQELAAHREKGVLSPFDLDLNFVAELWSAGGRLIRNNMLHPTGLQALVLTFEDLEAIGGLEFEHATLGMQVINPGDFELNDVFILYPWEVADIATLQGGGA